MDQRAGLSRVEPSERQVSSTPTADAGGSGGTPKVVALAPPPPPPAEVSTPRFAPGFAVKLNLATDLVILIGAVFLSAWLAGWKSGPWTSTLLLCAGISVMVWAVVGTALCLYNTWVTERDMMDDVALVTVQVMAVLTVQVVMNLWLSSAAGMPSIPWFLLLVWPSVLSLRLFLFRRLSIQEHPAEEVLIVGAGTMGQLTGKQMEADGRRKVVGHLRFGDESGVGASVPLLGSVGDLESVLRRVPVDVVYITGNVRKHAEDMQTAIKQCERFGVPFALPAYHFRLDRARPASKHGVENGFLHFVTYDSKPHQLALKRLFDIVASAAALWVLLPLFTVVAAIIKLTSRGPIFFKQVRVGLNGKPFNMIKFRSMVVNAEELKEKLARLNEQTGPVFKMKNDPRITRIGRFIRKYSIDELPQLINVLRGEMSVVGPRPPVPSEVAKYEAWQRRRFSVRPGLTCIWQVSGRNQIGFEQWMYLDMQYIDHWSLKKDIDLVLRTVPIVITGQGAS